MRDPTELVEATHVVVSYDEMDLSYAIFLVEYDTNDIVTTFLSIRDDVKSIRDDVESIRDDVKSIRDDVESIRHDVESIRHDDRPVRDVLPASRLVDAAWRSHSPSSP